jgi:hypothetical protein
MGLLEHENNECLLKFVFWNYKYSTRKVPDNTGGFDQ